MVAKFEADGLETIVAAAETITKALKQNGRVYVCGNGGSAADAQHIASELVGRFEHERKGLAAIALTTDTSVITSISNDYGFKFDKRLWDTGQQLYLVGMIDITDILN
ncbi:unnamed protein product [marine sediment metagenome]|uniref:SIS domain-containing protein n=1 Tax=marine sediment metagenome TaxID=412755 RepID=X1L202_9ZZZZ